MFKIRRFTYDEPMSVESCVASISELALDFSDVSESGRKKTMSRPFGVALLVAGIESDGTPVLWVSDPSGTCVILMYTNQIVLFECSTSEKI